MMNNLKIQRLEFEKSKKIYENKLLTFSGCEGKDVYNCTIPFEMQGKRYVFGRVERHNEFTRSWVYLFEEVAPDSYTVVPNSMIYHLEDPSITFINGELILEGTHTIFKSGTLDYYNAFFYHGTDIDDLYYFTTGPDKMKDIRLVQLDNKIGVFSRPNGKVGFTVIDNIMDLNDSVIENAPIIDLIDSEGYGGVNQCHYLGNGLIGLIGHDVYTDLNADGQNERVYIVTASVFDIKENKIKMKKIIATRSCFPSSDYIKIAPNGARIGDVAFPSGIVFRDDGKVDLYSGLSDALQGRITIDNPFKEYGTPKYSVSKQ